jgi:hypothetical protein
MQSRVMQGGFAAAALMFVAVLVPNSVSADEGGCHSYEGDFTAVTPAECPSFLCTDGTLTGDLSGSYDFVATGVTPTGELAGASTITLETGAVIFGSDVSVLNPDGTFVTTVTIVGGTRQFEHATGTIVANGRFTATGTEGEYSAEICLGVGAD